MPPEVFQTDQNASPFSRFIGRIDAGPVAPTKDPGWPKSRRRILWAYAMTPVGALLGALVLFPQPE